MPEQRGSARTGHRPAESSVSPDPSRPRSGLLRSTDVPSAFRGEADLGRLVYLHRFLHDLTVASGQRGLPDFLRRDRGEARYARLTGHTPRDMDFHMLYAALRHAIVMLRIAYRQAYFGEVAVPADPGTLILHHDSLCAMVQGTYRMR